VRAAILLAGTLALTAQESIIHTVDGLNRPLPGVIITIYCDTGNRHLTSDTNGQVRGTFDRKTCTSASVAKAGYTAYSTGFRDRYILNRKLTAIDVERLINTGTSDAIRELLSSDTPKLNEAIFQFEHRLRPILRALLKDPQVTLAAREFLARIADPNDIEQLLTLAPPPEDEILPGRWRHSLVTALIQPTTESGWEFLELCARNDFNNESLERSAIQSLQLNGSPRAQALLKSLPVTPRPSPSITHPNLEAAAKTIAQALNPKTWQRNEAPRFNEAADKALIDLIFQTDLDRFVHTATFHKIEGLWTLRNVQRTLQAFSPNFKAAPPKP
jgi:hypothetical protein